MQNRPVLSLIGPSVVYLTIVQIGPILPTSPGSTVTDFSSCLSAETNLSLNTEPGPSSVSPTCHRLVIVIPVDAPHSQEMTPRPPAAYSVVAVVIVMKLALVIPIAIWEALAR